MRKIHDAAAARRIPVLTSEVSRRAQPLFQYFGFKVVEEREPVIGGVKVPNVLMEKRLSSLSAMPPGVEPGGRAASWL